jgi:hypothetical protein
MTRIPSSSPISNQPEQPSRSVGLILPPESIYLYCLMTPAPCTTHAWQSTDTEVLQHPCLFLQSATRRILLAGFACQDPPTPPTRLHVVLTLTLVHQRLLTIEIATAASACLASHAQGTRLGSPEHLFSTSSGPGVTHDPYSSVLLALIAIIALFSPFAVAIMPPTVACPVSSRA